MSVNDAFVMNEWKLAQKADRVTFLPDGNGEFTDGMLVCWSARKTSASAVDRGVTRCWFKRRRYREDVH